MPCGTDELNEERPGSPREGVGSSRVMSDVSAEHDVFRQNMPDDSFG